jgi:hypothetical protein
MPTVDYPLVGYSRNLTVQTRRPKNPVLVPEGAGYRAIDRKESGIWRPAKAHSNPLNPKP